MSDFARFAVVVLLAVSLGALTIAVIQWLRGKSDDARAAALASGYSLFCSALGYFIASA